MWVQLFCFSAAVTLSAIAKGPEQRRREWVTARIKHHEGYPPADSNRKQTTVPLHDELAKGTLKEILRDAEITVEQLIELL